jgi:hypothetical protein
MRGTLLAGVLVAVAAVASAQEGFPLDGTWRSQAVAADGSERTLVLILQWDGKQVAGTINPGPEGVDFTGATLDPEGWKVKLVARDAAGGEIRLEGAIANLGKYNRVIEGQWTEGGRTQNVRFVHE